MKSVVAGVFVLALTVPAAGAFAQAGPGALR
jgi:hypothetical protein